MRSRRRRRPRAIRFATTTDDARDNSGAAADGLLINGSVNNGAASPFAQARAFGNNRPGGRGLYNGGIALLTSNSALDGRPFSFNGQTAPKPDYNDLQFNATFGGPIKIPRLLRRGPNFFGNYQRSQDHNNTSQSAVMPTALERAGDFSQSRTAFGQPVQLIDPNTGQPFPGNVIPADRLSPQATALLRLLPAAELPRRRLQLSDAYPGRRREPTPASRASSIRSATDASSSRACSPTRATRTRRPTSSRSSTPARPRA